MNKKEKQKILDFLKNPETYLRVKEILLNIEPTLFDKINERKEEYGHKSWLICGGSVSNILYGLYNKKEDMVINDIDVFYSVGEDYEFNGKSNVVDDYISFDNGYYHIVDEERDGVINNVDVLLNKVVNKVITGFDLNCVMSGIDDNEIVYTDEFVSFLFSKQIEVVRPFKPLHTAVRLFNKLKDIPDVYCNVEMEMSLLEHVTHGTNTMVSHKLYEKYLKNKDILDQYFTFTVNVNNKTDVFSHYYHAKNVKTPLTQVPIYTFVLFNILNKETKTNINKVMTILPLNEKNTNSVFNYSNPYIKLIYNNKDFYKCDVSKKMVNRVGKFINNHYSFSNMKVKNLIELNDIIIKVNQYIKKEGEWVVGVFENLYCFDYSEFNGIIDWDVFEKKISETKNQYSTPLNVPLNLKDFKYKDYVFELSTTLQLMNEGKMMGHCVGGYSENLRSGKSRIFHIESNGVGSTVEIGTDYWTNKRVTIKQHHGRYPEKGNLEPTQDHKNIVSELFKFIKENELIKVVELEEPLMNIF